MITTYGAYQINALFFDIIKKDDHRLLENLYCICVMNEIYWAIPLSEEVQRLKDIVQKRIAERKKAQTTVFTTAFGRPYALVLNDALPIHPVFLKDPLRNTLGEILTLPEDEAALTLKWLRRHIIQDKKKIMPFAKDVRRLSQIAAEIDDNANILKKVLQVNPERMDVLSANNKIHHLVTAELKEDPDCAMYASYLDAPQRKAFDFFPSPKIFGKKKYIRWSENVLEDIRKRKKYQTLSMIAKDYTVSQPTISKLLLKRRKKEELNMFENTQNRIKAPSTKSRFNNKDCKKMREMYWQRLSLQEIGDYFGVSRETIRKELKKNGITSELRKKMSFENIEYFLKQGLSVPEIAEKTNLSIPYLNKVIRNNNLKPKDD